VRTEFHEMMARTGRIKAVGLGAREKVEFLGVWRRRR
jgi:hypothetical protein